MHRGFTGQKKKTQSKTQSVMGIHEKTIKQQFQHPGLHLNKPFLQMMTGDCCATAGPALLIGWSGARLWPPTVRLQICTYTNEEKEIQYIKTQRNAAFCFLQIYNRMGHVAVTGSESTTTEGSEAPLKTNKNKTTTGILQKKKTTKLNKTARIVNIRVRAGERQRPS